MTGRISKAMAFGIACVGLGLVLGWAGLTPLSQDRDADGYLLSDALTVDRSSHAVMTSDVELLRGHHECAGEETFLLDFYSPG